MNSILAEIADYKRGWVAQRRQQVSEQELLLRCQKKSSLDFSGALTAPIAHRKTTIIAEVKKASPSKGVICSGFDPVAIATSYEKAGACCLSVLTDEKYFQGMDAYLSDIRASVGLPILRKDFMLDPYQVLEARFLGADAILIIMAMVDDSLAEELSDTARELGLAVLPEVHDHEEMERALALNTSLLGINNRDLHNFDTHLETTLDLLKYVPENCTVITESGIHTRKDIEHMQSHGIYGFLIGESLMRQPDPGLALAHLLKD